MEIKPNFLPTSLHLPLFMLTRRGINHKQLKDYFHLHSSRLVKNCRFENNLKNETITLRKLRDTLQTDTDKSQTECNHHDRKIKPRVIYKHLPWQLPPNIYKVAFEPFKHRKGNFGAYWCKLPAASKQKLHYPTSVVPLTKYTDKFHQTCNKHKGVFLNNARDRRATDRCMVSSLVGCYKSPQHPGPGYYNIPEDNSVKIRKWHAQSEYIFYKASIVPIKRNAIHGLHTSFYAGPGRYETRFPRTCPCPRYRMYYPHLRTAMEKQRIAKALGLPLRKFNPNLFCSHDLANVAGHGHSHLFKTKQTPKEQKPKKTEIKANTVASLKRLTALNIIKYMTSMYSTKAKVNSKPRTSIRALNFKFRFHSVGKIKIRRPALRKKRRIAFGSGIGRFETDVRSRGISTLLKSGMSLLRTRRTITDFARTAMYDHVESRLFQIPQHMQATFQPELRRRLFKFLPLPPPKILLSQDDIWTTDIPKTFSFFAKPIDPVDYLKSDVVLTEDYRKMLDKYTKTKLLKNPNKFDL